MSLLLLVMSVKMAPYWGKVVYRDCHIFLTSSVNSTVQRLEDEKQSLITTLKLVQKETQTVQPDLNDRMQNLENENKSLSTALTLLQHELDNTQQHKWKVVKTKYNKPPPETPAG